MHEIAKTNKEVLPIHCYQSTAKDSAIQIYLSIYYCLSNTVTLLQVNTAAKLPLDIFKDSWGYFQEFLWRPKLPIFHNKKNRLHPLLWQPKQVFFPNPNSVGFVHIPNQSTMKAQCCPTLTNFKLQHKEMFIFN